MNQNTKTKTSFQSAETKENLLHHLDSLDGEYVLNAPLKNYSTIKVGGPAAVLFYPADQESLCKAIAFLQHKKMSWMVVGNLSNTIFSDQGYPGCLICLKKMNQFTFDGNRLTAKAGAMWSTLSKEAAKRGLSGLEFTCGIPGTVGAAVCINAGAQGSEIANILKKATLYNPNGDINTYTNQELNFGYRSSNLLKSKKIVLEATFQLLPRPTNDIQKEMDALLRKREQTQPINYPSSGSIFKNPPGHKTAQLIEQCGLKGLRIGDAQISEKHSNFIVNRSNASFEQITELISKIKKAVLEHFSINLEKEVELVDYQ